MSRLSFKENGEEHNFWQNYTDLMSGLLIVFIIASLIAYNNYHKLGGGIIELVGGSKTGELTDTQKEHMKRLVANAELYEKVRQFDKAQESLNSKYFHYDKKYRRYECKLDVPFQSDSFTISPRYNSQLINAGNELHQILKKFPSSDNIGFKVVIEGRAALKYGSTPSQASKQYADMLSYRRARNLYYLWKNSGIIDNIERRGGELFVSGSGYYGKGRHTIKTDPKSSDPEGLNKRFIIEVIPFIKF